MGKSGEAQQNDCGCLAFSG